MARFKSGQGLDGTEHRIETRTGPFGARAHHIGGVDEGPGGAPYYAYAIINRDSAREIFRSSFFGSVRGAKTWIKEQLPHGS